MMTNYQALTQEILSDIKNNKSLLITQNKIDDDFKADNVNYESATRYSKSLGTAISDSFTKNVKDVPVEELGIFAMACVALVYRKSQQEVNKLCKMVQKKINSKAGISLNPVDVNLNDDRISNLINRFEEATSFEDVAFLLKENVARSIARDVVNSNLKANMDFQEKSGLKVVISRTDNNCCSWCASMTGIYYSRADLPSDFWKVHRNCSCVFDYKVNKTSHKIRYIEKDGILRKITEDR